MHQTLLLPGLTSPLHDSTLSWPTLSVGYFHRKLLHIATRRSCKGPVTYTYADDLPTHVCKCACMCVFVYWIGLLSALQLLSHNHSINGRHYNKLGDGLSSDENNDIAVPNTTPLCVEWFGQYTDNTKWRTRNPTWTDLISLPFFWPIRNINIYFRYALIVQLEVI